MARRGACGTEKPFPFRRNKGFAWGLFYWMLDDCWPASGWALIDYYALPKAEGAYRVTVCTDTAQAARGEGTLRLVNFAGEGKTWRFAYEAAQNKAQIVFRLPAGEAEAALNENAVLVCDIAGDRAILMEKSPAFLRFPPARDDGANRRGTSSRAHGCLRTRGDARRAARFQR